MRVRERIAMEKVRDEERSVEFTRRREALGRELTSTEKAEVMVRFMTEEERAAVRKGLEG